MAVPEERYDLYMKINMWGRALEMAQKLKDRERLLQIKSLCKDEKVMLAVDQVMNSGNI
jgi:hypothetical protein